MAVQRSAHVSWSGDLTSGSGTYTLASGAATGRVTWASRAEEPAGLTSPEELIAAAHASCFSMALAHALSQAGTPPTRLDTDATATFERGEDGFRLTRMLLRVRGLVPGADEESFRRAAEGAKEGCPVSKALAGNVDITLDAALGPD
jgi:osmotically inducible protein OsmC